MNELWGAPLSTYRDRVVGKEHYSNFERSLKGWSYFEKAATSTEPHWFKSLLPLWCPSGQAIIASGL
jgi:hypothetical protein